MEKLNGPLNLTVVHERTVAAAQILREEFISSLQESAVPPADQYAPGTQFAQRIAANDKRQARNPNGHSFLVAGGQNHEMYVHRAIPFSVNTRRDIGS